MSDEPSLLLSVLLMPEWLSGLRRRNLRFERPYARVEGPLADALDAALKVLRGDGTPQATTLHLTALASTLIESFGVEVAAAARDEDVARVLDHMIQSNDLGMQVESLSAMAAMSRSAFFERFKQEVGTTPHQVLDWMRMEGAVRDLTTTKQTISEIAFRLGFSTAAHFSRFLVQRVMVTPKRYRIGSGGASSR